MLINHSSMKFLVRLKSSNWVLEKVAGSADLACMPQRFIYFLSKINYRDDQEEAVENGVYALVDKIELNALILFSLHLVKKYF